MQYLVYSLAKVKLFW